MKKEEIIKFYDKFKIFIFPTVVGLSSVLLVVLVIFPQVSIYLENQQIAGGLEEKSKFLEKKAQELEGYNGEDLDANVKSALSSYPSDKDYINSLTLLQNIVSQSSFATTVLALGISPDKSGSVKSYTLKLDVLGPTSQLPTLLTNIESSYRLMRVASMETSGGKDGQTTVSMNIELLYAPAPTGFGSVDSPLPTLSEDEVNILSRLKAVGDLIVAPSEGSVQLGPRGKTDPFQ